MEICKNMKKLKSFVHVSTAYCNAHKKEIEEKVYEAPYHPAFLIDFLKSLPTKTVKKIEQDIIGNYPNSYIFSKALAENVVLEYFEIIPSTIVRPSMVHSTWKEPFSGWVEIASAGTPIIALAVRGLLKSMFLDEKINVDLIPVDIVANTLITAAWHSTINRSNTIKVYNCSSGQINPIKWTKYMDQMLTYAREYPTSKIIFYPGCFYISNTMVEKTMHIFVNYIPAVILDIYRYINNEKPIMRKMCQNIMKLCTDAVIAIRVPLIFHTNTFKSLMEAVKNTEDGENFDIDIRKENGFDWENHNKAYMLGIRKYICKDDISNLDQTRRKLKWIYWITRMAQVISVATLISYTISLNNIFA